MLFNYFPPIKYNGAPTADIFRPHGNYFDDILSKFIVRKYIVSGSPRPEVVSYDLYGDTKYYWILLFLNQVYDPFYDWICEEEIVHQYTAQKYKNLPAKEGTVLYHIDENGEMYFRMKEYPVGSGVWYDEGDTAHLYKQYVGTLVPVTAIEHELATNESKRTINVLNPSDLGRFMDEYTRLMERIRGNK
ncbi:baseplate wedge subunit [Aeromonas phage AS-yj]|uniref:Baseplate wedge subunit n=3 Tax=Caudoviricetes TaxID=2731619 RepID=A0A411B896_9CAUD|nr:baseplate wedge subunit [Aeromonas phage AS-yj]QAX97839.1 baseplate wedge subunit [Aeromonas phage Asswx_1]QAX99110.1 baseplate wedge subunit [Aeromonas phage Assk]UKM62878.1 putative baseplate wedge subunit [Aeromonas phage P19]